MIASIEFSERIVPMTIAEQMAYLPQLSAIARVILSGGREIFISADFVSTRAADAVEMRASLFEFLQRQIERLSE